MQKANVKVATLRGNQNVSGYKVDFEGADLVVHKCIKNEKLWVVTESLSGMQVRTGKTRKEAIENALKVVENIGLEAFKEKVEQAIKNVEQAQKAQKEYEAEKAAQAEAEKAEKAAQAEKEKQAEQPKKEEPKREPKFKMAQIVEVEIGGQKRVTCRVVKLPQYDQNKNSYTVQPIGSKIYTQKFETLEKLMHEVEQQEDQSKTENKTADESLLKKVWFAGIKTLDELKKMYKSLAKKFHPDTSEYSNATEVMKKINAQYEEAEKTVKRGDTVEDKESYKQGNIDIPADMQEVINKISHLEGIEIKIRGTWLWVGGLTHKDKDKHAVLKSAGMRFGAKAKEWYYASEIGEKKRRGKGYNKQQLKEKFGEVNLNKKQFRKDFLENKSKAQ